MDEKIKELLDDLNNPNFVCDKYNSNAEYDRQKRLEDLVSDKNIYDVDIEYIDNGTVDKEGFIEHIMYYLNPKVLCWIYGGIAVAIVVISLMGGNNRQEVNNLNNVSSINETVNDVNNRENIENVHNDEKVQKSENVITTKKDNKNNDNLKEKDKTVLSEPERELYAYYRNITDKNFEKAYNGLNDTMKNQMGVYESFTKGYDDTISSTIEKSKVMSMSNDSAVIEYTLVAIDRIPNSIKRKKYVFSGVANMSKQKDKWLISRFDVKQVSESTI